MNKTPPVRLAISCGHNIKDDSIEAAVEKLHAYRVKGTSLESLVLYREIHDVHSLVGGGDFNKFTAPLLPGLPNMVFSALALACHPRAHTAVLGNDF